MYNILMDDCRDPKYFVVFCRLRQRELLVEREYQLRWIKQLQCLWKEFLMTKNWIKKLHNDKLLLLRIDENRDYLETRFFKESGFFSSPASINTYLKDLMNDEFIMRKRIEDTVFS